MSYHELNLEERIAIRVGLVKKLSLREIARQLKRSPPTISREVRRNSDASGNYTAQNYFQLRPVFITEHQSGHSKLVSMLGEIFKDTSFRL